MTTSAGPILDATTVDAVDTRGGDRGSVFVRLLRRPAGLVSLAVLALILLVAILAPWISPHDPNEVILSQARALPSWAHPLGGDNTGRDVLSRLIWGTQITLWGAFVSILTSLVLGVPSGNFKGQEYGSNTEIAAFCKAKAVKFPLAEKSDVVGPQALPIYRWAATKLGAQNTPKWNFHKYLIGRDGKVAAHFGSRTKPDAPEVIAAIEAALRQPAPKNAGL